MQEVPSNDFVSHVFMQLDRLQSMFSETVNVKSGWGLGLSSSFWFGQSRLASSSSAMS